MRHVIDTNVTGTVYLVHKVGNDMRARRSGRILFTGSIAGFMPGHLSGGLQRARKAFIDSFSFALRAELKDSGVTVTCLMPGATETDFFERADMLDTKVGQSKKDDPADVAKVGYDAMMAGDGDVVSGWQNKLRSAIALDHAVRRARRDAPQQGGAGLRERRSNGDRVHSEPSGAAGDGARRRGAASSGAPTNCRTERHPLGALLATTGAGLIWRSTRSDTRARLGGARGTSVEESFAINRSAAGALRVLAQPRTAAAGDAGTVVGAHDRPSPIALGGEGAGRLATEWYADIINDIPNELIAWRTIEGSRSRQRRLGTFRAGPVGRGTTVRVKLQYDPPAGKLGAAFAWLFGDEPSQVIREGLRRFKQLMETGEIPTTDGQPRGKR